MPKIGTQTTVIDCSEWDELVEKTYGRTYCFQQQEGCQERGVKYLTIPDYAEDYEADSIPEVINGDIMGVSFKTWLDRHPQQGKDLFWERNFYPELQMVANDLHSKGLIDAGEYMINIDW